ncbi:MCE family protein [Gordonia sinesedis]
MTAPDLTRTSGPGRWFTPRHIVMLAIGLILALIVAGALWWVFNSMGRTKITAMFERSVGIYSGSDVRLLGVGVGKVDSVEPAGKAVKITMTVDRGIDLPADVRAVQITPSVVADRYVQLTPAYSGGPKAPKNINLSLDQTMEPVEVDQLYRSLQKLSTALGPTGANKDGAVSELISVSADNLDGNGEKLGQAFEQLSKASTTLSDSRGNLVDTIKNLDVFVGALEENDAQVRKFNAQMASFTTFLADEREQLGQALNKLSIALGDVATFIADNRENIGQTLKDLQPTTQALVDTRASLKEVLMVLPLTINNLINSYDAESGTIGMHLTLPDLQDPLGAGCRFLDLGKLLPGNPAFDQFSDRLKPLINQCEGVAKQIERGVLEPLLPVLPFGIMSGNKLQQLPVPGTVPPNQQQPGNRAPAQPSAPAGRGGN